MSGVFDHRDGRRCFRPHVPDAPADSNVEDVLEEAARAIAEFDSAICRFPGGSKVEQLFAYHDAVQSSAAEGSTTSFSDLLRYRTSLGTAPDVADAASVSACSDCYGIGRRLPHDPVGVVQAIHKRLFEGSQDPLVATSAGRLKARANGVADPDEPGGFHTYTSPDMVEGALEEWSQLTLGDDPPIHPLVRQGMSHWMFEHIHPFADGNGRIGRILVPLTLRRSGFTRRTCAFLGEAVNEDKELYLEALKAARRAGIQMPWLRVFLGMVARTARANLRRLGKLTVIRQDWEARSADLLPRSPVHRLVPWMLTTPVFTVGDAVSALGLGYTVANEAVDKAMALGMVDIRGDARRDRLFQAGEVLDLFEAPRP